MRSLLISILMIGALGVVPSQAERPGAKPTATLTVDVEGVNAQGGNIGVMVFQSAKGWPEDNGAAYRAVVVPAHRGTVVVTVPDLPVGEYAIAVGHDVNLNRKVDRNWLGKPLEQWGMSNNPHPKFRTPEFSRAKFIVGGNEEIRIQMQ